MRGAVAGFVTVATAFIAAGIVFSIVQPKSQGPAVVKDVVGGVTQLGGDLFQQFKG